MQFEFKMQLMLKIIIFCVCFCSVSVKCEEVSLQEGQTWIPKIIWTWWETKIRDNEHFLKIFGHNHNIMKGDWEIRHLDDSNIDYWLAQVPGFGDTLYQPFIRNQQASKKSNLIRLAIIKHFGGVYLDYSIILTETMDWLLRINESTLVKNKHGQWPDVVLLYNDNHGNIEPYYDSFTQQTVLINPVYESYFLAARPNTKFIQQWFQTYVMSLKKSWKWQSSTKKMLSEDIDIIKEGYSRQYFEQFADGSHIQARRQKQLDKGWNNTNNQKRQYAVKYYNIWVYNANSTALKLHDVISYNKKQLVALLFQSDIYYLESHNIGPKYFIKFFNAQRRELKNFLLDIKTYWLIYCPKNFYILKNSVGYQYILKDYNGTKFYKNDLVDIAYNKNCLSVQDLKYSNMFEWKLYRAKDKEYHYFYYKIFTVLGIVMIICLYYVIKLKREKTRLKELNEGKRLEIESQGTQLKIEQK